MFSDLLADVRYGIRTLLKSPGFTLIAVLALALGIGANTAIFSVVNAVVMRPLPWKDSDRLVRIWESAPKLGWPQFSVSIPNLIDWRAQNDTFEELGAWRGWSFNYLGTGGARKLSAGLVSANFLTLLGTPPVVGRGFLDSEEKPGGDSHVVILTHSFWKENFGGDPEVVSRKITLSGESYEIVGVLPERFDWLVRTDLFTPLVLDPKENRSNHVLLAFGRLKPGVTVERATSNMDAIAARLAKQYPQSNEAWGVRLKSFYNWIVNENVRRALLVLTGAVGFVLLIACANVTNLLLARGVSRSREIAIRTALGAGRMRVVRQLLVESAILAVAGGGVGVLLALWTVDLLRRLDPGTVPRLDTAGLDLRVLAFTGLLALLTSVLFGLLPALQTSRPDVSESLKESGRAIAGSARQRLRSALVVAEVALSLTLLIGAGLLLRSFWGVLSIDTGFKTSGLVAMRISLPPTKYPDDPAVAAFYEQFLGRLRSTPGIEAAASASDVPFGDGNTANDVTIEGLAQSDASKPSADWRLVSPGFFKTMQIPLLAGRDFTPADDDKGPPVVIVSETMAKRFWPGGDAMGKRLHPGAAKTWSTVVGIARDITQTELESERRPLMYYSAYQANWNPMALVVRSDRDTGAVTSLVRSTMATIDPEIPVSDIQTFETMLSSSVAPRRFNAVLLAVFAGLALVLASLGIYGVMAYSVSQRTHEIGVRMALGSRPRDVVSLVVRRGMSLALLGLSIGVVAALACTRLLGTMLYEIGPADPVTFIGVSALLAAVALAACWIPARRAARVDPMVALRSE